MTPKELRESLSITLKELQFNAIYLEEKGLIELQKPLEGSLFVGARATPRGIDLVEDDYQLEVLFPTRDTQRAIPAVVFENLRRLISEVSESHELGEQQKEMITEEIKEVLNELEKSEPSYSLLKKSLGKLRERSSDVYGKLKAIVKDPTVIRILNIAARKELGI